MAELAGPMLVDLPFASPRLAFLTTVAWQEVGDHVVEHSATNDSYQGLGNRVVQHSVAAVECCQELGNHVVQHSGENPRLVAWAIDVACRCHFPWGPRPSSDHLDKHRKYVLIGLQAD